MRLIPGSDVLIHVGSTNEKRRVTLAMPTVFVSGPSRVFASWRIKCVADGSTSGTATTAAGPTMSVNRFTIGRNLAKGAAWTAHPRSMVTFSTPGDYVCNGWWGARTSDPDYVDGSRSIKLDPENTLGGSLKVSAPVGGSPDFAKQCFLPEQLYDNNERPPDCYFSLESVPTGEGLRLVPQSTSSTVDAIRVTPPTDGRLIRIQATVKVTTCSGQGVGEGNAGCHESDVGGTGHSVFEGRLKFVLPGTSTPLPGNCITPVTGSPEVLLDVSRIVHHSVVQWHYEFALSPADGCDDFKVTSKIAVVSGQAGKFDPFGSQLSITSA